MKRSLLYRSAMLALLMPLLVGADDDGSGCTNQQKAAQEALEKAQDRRAYVQQHDIEFNNYDKRQRRSDDPTAILWCTSAFPIPSSPLFTVPIVGKLTSGGKRPFAGDPGPDGMYGSSGEYRYGFSPSDVYMDFYGMPTFCTDEPMIWQRQATKIVMQTDPALLKAHEAARAILKRGIDGDKIDDTALQDAYRTLSEAIDKTEGKNTEEEK